MSDKDLMEVDFWSSMVDYRAMSDESLRERFQGFSLRANQWLYKEWTQANGKEPDERLKQIIGILQKVIQNQS